MCPRDDDGAAHFDDKDLFDSCPGGPGSAKLVHADRCTLVNIESFYTREWFVLGDVQRNCGGSEDEVTVTIGGEQTVSETTTLNANVAFSLGPVQIGGGISQSWTESTTVSKSIEYAIRPGRQAVYVAGVVHSNETGIVQVNYGVRQYGHYIWFTQSTVTRLTPVREDIQYDVHVTDCGADPRDLSGLNTTVSEPAPSDRPGLRSGSTSVQVPGYWKSSAGSTLCSPGPPIGHDLRPGSWLLEIVVPCSPRGYRIE
ncbi:hypothetical protein C8Q76DRAFT_13027 [Earliella scabrosa]|nr:hypothetical protein C8Q76DRAFT_13027 [Earliella scabrosa]